MVRTATPFPMVSLLFVFTAFVISNIGHIRPQRTILAFVSGIFFILSGTMHSISLFVMHGYMFFLRFVLIRALSLCSGARCAKTQILFSRGTTTDSKLLSCVVSTFSNYSAVAEVVAKEPGRQTLVHSCPRISEGEVYGGITDLHWGSNRLVQRVQAKSLIKSAPSN